MQVHAISGMPSSSSKVMMVMEKSLIGDGIARTWMEMGNSPEVAQNPGDLWEIRQVSCGRDEAFWEKMVQIGVRTCCPSLSL